MKLTWQLMRKSMNTQIDYAHMRIKTCIENYQNGSGCILGSQATMHYQEMGLVHNWWIQSIARMSPNKIRNHQEHTWHFIRIHFYFKENLFDVGPHQSPIYFAWINSNSSIIWNYGIWFLAYLKKKKIEDVWKLLAKKKDDN